MHLHFSTPDDSMNNSNSCSGLKFTFEAQSNSYNTPSQTPDIKESPPSSPGSEIGGRKRSGAPTEAKDFKIFQKNVHATHMLGNQLNPTSSMAQKMSDQLHMEMEAHSVYNAAPSLESGTPLVGPAFPGKQISNVIVMAFSMPALIALNNQSYQLITHQKSFILCFSVATLHRLNRQDRRSVRC